MPISTEEFLQLAVNPLSPPSPHCTYSVSEFEKDLRSREMTVQGKNCQKSQGY